MRKWGALVGVGVCALAGAAAAVPAATNAKSPNGKVLRALQGVNFISSCRLSHRLMDDPIVFPGISGPIARSHLRRQHDHERVLDTRVAPRRLDNVQARGRYRGLLDAHASAQRSGGLATRRDHLLPAPDDRAR